MKSIIFFLMFLSLSQAQAGTAKISCSESIYLNVKRIEVNLETSTFVYLLTARSNQAKDETLGSGQIIQTSSSRGRSLSFDLFENDEQVGYINDIELGNFEFNGRGPNFAFFYKGKSLKPNEFECERDATP